MNKKKYLKMKEYEKLLDAYENEIDTLNDKIEKTEDENEYLQQLLFGERKLRKLVG